VSNNTIGKFLLRLRELTVDGNSLFDMYNIGEDIGLVDRIQTDHIVEILEKDGYIGDHKGNSKIRLSDEGRKRLESIQT